MILKGRIIQEGLARGEVVKFDEKLIVLGDINPKDGTVKDIPVKGKILVFPRGAGSTVGSYTIYGLRYYDNAPAGMILEEAETIVAAGAIIAEIPTVDMVDISQIKNGDFVIINNDNVEITSSRPHTP